MQAFAELPEKRFVWQYNGPNIPNLPSNVYVADWLPQQDLLGYSIVITISLSKRFGVEVCLPILSTSYIKLFDLWEKKQCHVFASFFSLSLLRRHTF